MAYQQQFRFSTTGRGTYNISDQVNEAVEKSGVKCGICQVFVQHTSASLVLCENADPDVRTDLEAFMKRLVPDGDKLYKHKSEGPDDMPAHIRTVLIQSSLSMPITNGKTNLGLWQGVYLWEHRINSFKRNITVTVVGD